MRLRAESLIQRNATSSRDAKRMLAGVTEDVHAVRPEALQDALRQVVEEGTGRRQTFDVATHCRVDPAAELGSSWRPHGDMNISPL